MADTNFAALTTEQKTVWSRDLWRIARNNSFVFKFVGRGPNAMIQRITELTKTERGDRAVITLVADLESDGVTGDYDLEGNEEAIKAYDQDITVDQLRNANRTKGKMSDQRSIVNFRETSRDVLGYWLGDRIDQMAFLTLSGVAYTSKNNGASRPVKSSGMNLGDLAFAADVTTPSAARHLRWVAANKGLDAADTSALVPSDTPSYAMLVAAKAYAKDNYIRGVKGPGNMEFYHVFMTPQGVAKLKLDPDYLANVRNAGQRGNGNPLFTGSVVTQDGLVIHEFRHVYNTTGLAGSPDGGTTAGSKWGSGGDVDGQRVLVCGAQALGMADLGMPDWFERPFDYGNKQGISIGKIFGLKKPVFRSTVSQSNEDFGVLCIDTAQ